ncbi:Exodeoxyribonuclease V gamma chain [Vulgatibacter incomptus]|uniref:Exodeoxyribonuclease V gamma chain n=2 Tax=Vulgatibacter incomptus TaxID=1391653 RepID=A0A0K1P849_9BACT|nr:Exodeoxyribonuclease V gamma chain [Vulgatibacter incomptus]
MIHLTYSNRTEALLDALAADLAVEGAAGRSPFEPTRLIVPNRNVEVWLKHGLARRMGIAANLDVQLLRRFVGGLLPEGMRLVDGPLLFDLVLSLLLDDDYLAHSALARPRSYLLAAGDGADAVDLRRFQLASQLARLFDEYGHARPEMLAAWSREPLLAGTPFAETEEWQRRIWLDLFAPDGLAERWGREQGIRYVQLQDLATAEGLSSPEKAPVHVFGVSYVASVFHRILARLASGSDLRVYSLNPCMEFWEDVEAAPEIRRRLARHGRLGGEGTLFREPDPFGLEAGGDTPALSLWGRPGRENIRLLNELAECDYRAVFEDPDGARSLLRQLQHDILVREPERTEPDPAFDFSADKSVRILACPGIKREAEAIAEAIWSLVAEDDGRGSGGEPLRFNDIAVLVAGSDPSAYFTHLCAAFEETWKIPYSLSDSAFAAESRIAEAAELLLALPAGRFTRAEVLAFVTHPAVMSRFPGVDASAWGRWCDRLGIVRGADRFDLRESYVEQDLLSWDQGLRRLALGAFLADADQPFEAVDEDVVRRYLPAEAGGEGEEGFGLFARSLIADLRAAKDARLTMSEWAGFLGDLVQAYLTPSGEAEARELERCLRTIRGIADTRLDDRPASFRIASELARQALGGLGGSRGQYLAGGVVVSTLQPMRAIPFRAVFIAGLGEGRFPAADRRNHLDLRLARPRAGDVSPREGDQYMFLEAILCARERLQLSFVARDQLTGDPLQPSIVVAELERMLARGYGATKLREELPLRRFEAPEAFASPQARREAQALALREELRRHLASGHGDGDRAASAPEFSERGQRATSAESRVPELDGLLDAVKPELRLRLAEAHGLHAHRLDRVTPLHDPSEALRLTLRDLRRFLECPLQGSAALLLGLRDDEEDGLLTLEDEALESSALDRSVFLADRFVAGVAGAGSGSPDFEASFDERAELERLAGRFPLGLFGEAERARQLGTLAEWGGTYQEIAAARGPGVEILRFGPAIEEDRGATPCDPVRIESVGGCVAHVEVRGRTGVLVAGRKGSLILKTPKVSDAVSRQKDALRAFVDRVILAAAGLADEKATHSAWFCRTADGKELEPIVFAPISRGEALEWLGTMAEDLVSRAHDYFLPCEAVFRSRAKPGMPLAEHVAKVADDRRKRPFDHGPVRGAEGFPPPPEDEALWMIERRFGLFFAKVGVVE